MSVASGQNVQTVTAVAKTTSQRSGTAIKGAPAGLFLNPAAILVLLLSIFPFFFSLAMTFTNWNLLYPTSISMGLENWRRMLGDETLARSVRNTLFFTVAATLLEYGLGLMLAMLVLQIKRGQRFFRVVYLLPMMISPAAVGYIIGRMLFSETQGPINNILFRLGLPYVPWTSNPASPRGRSSSPMSGSGRRSCSSCFWPACSRCQTSHSRRLGLTARADGRSSPQITFPLLLPVTVTAVLIRSLELFKLIDLVRVITAGGPARQRRP